MSVEAVHGSAVKEEGYSSFWQKQNSNEERGPLKRKEEV